MVKGLWGRKIGMTQVFSGDKVVPVTVIDVAHWVITNVKTQERDGYQAVQVGCVKKRYAQKAFSAAWLKKPKEHFSAVREIHLNDGSYEAIIGQPVDFSKIVALGDTVDVFGKTKGCGFAGVVKRHRFAGPPGSHGSTMGKRPGSIGTFATQGKVIKGKKMPGRMGNKQRVMRNLDVVKVEAEANFIAVKGSIPGKTGSLVFIRKA